MTRFLLSTGVVALALASTPAIAQVESDQGSSSDAAEASGDDYVYDREVVDDFVNGGELEAVGSIAEGECVPTSDEEFMRTGVETICAERGGPIRTYFSRSAQRPAPAPTATQRPRRPRASTPAPRPRPRATPRPVRIPERCAPSQSASLNMCLTFGLGSSNLTRTAQNQVRVFAESLLENESSETFIIAGHTDTTGSETRNCELSRERAQSVVEFMVQMGVSADQLRPVGFGQEQLTSGVSATDPRNRRVEIVRGDAEQAANQACTLEASEAGDAAPA